VTIQHIGSTSIPGLCAKPVIDIAAAVEELRHGEQCVKPLAEVGYEYKGDAGLPGRHFFAKGSKDHRTHYLHVEELNGTNWLNHILFRDYLWKQPADVSKYADLKADLAGKYSDDRVAYAAGKDAYIEAIIGAASRLYELDEFGRTRAAINKRDSYKTWSRRKRRAPHRLAVRPPKSHRLVDVWRRSLGADVFSVI